MLLLVAHDHVDLSEVIVDAKKDKLHCELRFNNPRSAEGIITKDQVFDVDLNSLRQRQEWKDCCEWVALYRMRTSPFMVDTRYMNYTALTFSGKHSYSYARMFFNAITHLYFKVPFVDAQFEDIDIVSVYNEGAKITSNIPHRIIEETEDPHSFYGPIPVLSGPDTIKTKSSVTFEVAAYFKEQPFDGPLEFEIDHINGYLPKTRLYYPAENKFTVHSLGLSPGDTIKVKVGYRYRSSVAEKEIRVV